MKRFTADAFAAMSRRRGYNVDKPAKEQLEERLRETLARIRTTGETLDELSRDGAAMLAVATQRPLTEDEALRVLAGHQYMEECLGSAEYQIVNERASSERQRENANAWSMSCADLGRSLERIAMAAGEPALAQDPERLAEVVGELAAGRIPRAALLVDNEHLARVLTLVARENARQIQYWESWGAQQRAMSHPNHARALHLLSELGAIASLLLADDGRSMLCEDLVRVAALAVLWIELLLPIQEKTSTNGAAAAGTVPQDEVVAHVTGQGSEGCRPPSHAAAGGEAVQGVDENTMGHAPARTGLPRDATTAALNAASDSLREHRIAVRLIAGAIADPALAEDPRLLADRVTETIEALKTELEASEANHNKTLELLGRQTRALAESSDVEARLRGEIEVESTWSPLGDARPARGWAVVTGEESVVCWALFDSESEAQAFAQWRQEKERVKDEDDQDPSWECVSVLPAQFPNGLPARFWNSLDPAPALELDQVAADEVQP
jgi:hypothetical protein